jgi:hypothetical protein
MLYTKGINPSVKNFRSLTNGIDHRWKKFDFWPIVSIHRLKIFFLMTTINIINVFCRQSIIGIDPIDVFLTIGAQLCLWDPSGKLRWTEDRLVQRQTCTLGQVGTLGNTCTGTQLYLGQTCLMRQTCTVDRLVFRTDLYRWQTRIQDRLASLTDLYPRQTCTRDRPVPGTDLYPDQDLYLAQVLIWRRRVHWPDLNLNKST